MDQQRIMEVAGLSELDTHRLAYFERAGYTEEELKAFSQWWMSVGQFSSGKIRQDLVDAFLHFLPDRGEEGLVEAMEAHWLDGLTGPLIAMLLRRHSEELRGVPLLDFQDEMCAGTLAIVQGESATFTITELGEQRTAQATIPWAELERLVNVGEDFLEYTPPGEGEFQVTIGAAPYTSEAYMPTPTLMVNVIEWGDTTAFFNCADVKRALGD